MKKYLKPVKFNTPDNKWVLKTIDSTTVELMLKFYPPNKVFGQEPPVYIRKKLTFSITSEPLFPSPDWVIRKYVLNSYIRRIDEEVEDKCPKCQGTPQTPCIF